MKRDELDRTLDEWLDRATREYGRVEPRSGFESRVVARVKSGLEPHGWRIGWRPLAVTIAAALIIAVLVAYRNLRDRGPGERASSEVVKKIVETPPKHLIALRMQTTPTAAARRSTPPESRSRSERPRGRFLSSGITDQERYLIAFAQASSAQGIAPSPEDDGFDFRRILEFEIPEFRLPKFELTALESEDGRELTTENQEDL